MVVLHKAEKRCFVCETEKGEEIGRLDYKIGTKGRVFSVHTEVLPQHRGQGLAVQMFDAFVTWVRESGGKVVPVCAFTKKMFEAYPQRYGDVLYTENEKMDE